MNHTSNTLPQRLLEGLNDLRRNQMYRDFTILAGSSEIYAHRAVLVSALNYFASARNFADAQQNKIIMDACGEKVLKLIVDFIYTTKITIDEHNVQSLLQASIYLQIIEVKDACCEFIKQRLTTMNHVSNILPHLLIVGLNHLRNNRMYCDVTILAGSSKLYAHRAVLVSVSNYFASMLAGNFAEAQQNEIVIDGCGEKDLKLIVDFIYTTKITIDEHNVQSLLQASIYLQIIEVKDACCEFIKQRLSPSNCLAVKQLAQENGCLELCLAAGRFVEMNFEKFLKTEEFKSLRIEQLMEIISSDNLVVKAEQKINGVMTLNQ